MTTTTTDALDLAIQQQALDIELQLQRLHQAPRAPIRIPILHNFPCTPFVDGSDSASKARSGFALATTCGIKKVLDLPVESNRHSLEQGGLERPQHEPHKLSDVGSNPTPATNPNAAAFRQVHVFPKGRWS